ncbi:MAG: hypothetical protein KTR35_13760 [Gammaproteobacteria bacterium]|nr:hypothetical protein [Gammaproteobacteria bacterium]
MKNETIAGFIGIVLISAFLLGLSASISQPPFWVISVIVLTGAWTAWIQDTILNPDAE